MDSYYQLFYWIEPDSSQWYYLLPTAFRYFTLSYFIHFNAWKTYLLSIGFVVFCSSLLFIFFGFFTFRLKVLFEEVSQQSGFWCYRFLPVRRFGYIGCLSQSLLLLVSSNFLRHSYHFQQKVRFCSGFRWNFSLAGLTLASLRWYPVIPLLLAGCSTPCIYSFLALLMSGVSSFPHIPFAAYSCFLVQFRYYRDCWTNFLEFQGHSDHHLRSADDLASNGHFQLL